MPALDVAELDVEDVDLVEDDLPVEEPPETVVVAEVVDAVELDPLDAVEAGVDEALDAQETADGTVIPLASQSWSAKVMVAGQLSMTEKPRAPESPSTVLILRRASLRDTAG